MNQPAFPGTRPAYVLIAAALFLAAVLSGAYNYYYSDTFTSLNTSAWSVVGSVTPTANGLTSSTGGQLYSLLGVPDGSSEYEVKGTLRLTGSALGEYSLELRSPRRPPATASISSRPACPPALGRCAARGSPTAATGPS